MGCSPWGREESDTTERLHIFHFFSLQSAFPFSVLLLVVVFVLIASRDRLFLTPWTAARQAPPSEPSNSLQGGRAGILPHFTDKQTGLEKVSPRRAKE